MNNVISNQHLRRAAAFTTLGVLQFVLPASVTLAMIRLFEIVATTSFLAGVVVCFVAVAAPFLYMLIVERRKLMLGILSTTCLLFGIFSLAIAATFIFQWYTKSLFLIVLHPTLYAAWWGLGAVWFSQAAEEFGSYFLGSYIGILIRTALLWGAAYVEFLGADVVVLGHLNIRLTAIVAFMMALSCSAIISSAYRWLNLRKKEVGIDRTGTILFGYGVLDYYISLLYVNYAVIIFLWFVDVAIKIIK